MTTMGVRPRALFFHAIPLALLGCGEGGAGVGGDAFVVTDSAGVEIAERRAPHWDAEPEGRWWVDAAPEFQIGAVEDSIYARVYPTKTAVRLESGRIVVAGQRSTLLWYGPGGESLFARGRGGGPRGSSGRSKPCSPSTETPWPPTTR